MSQIAKHRDVPIVVPEYIALQLNLVSLVHHLPQVIHVSRETRRTFDRHVINQVNRFLPVLGKFHLKHTVKQLYIYAQIQFFRFFPGQVFVSQCHQ